MEKTESLRHVDTTKYDKFYRGAVIIGTDPDDLIVYEAECKDHEHFFVILNEAYDHEDVVNVRVELKNPTFTTYDTRINK